ncbi:MAG: leucyl aminopeptidase [Ardenticatenales bacterium]|nr:leucyl aminopeptidase [Ardenticatenales bacterium]
MPLPPISVRHGAIQDADADALIVNLFAGVAEPGGATVAVDTALGGAIRDLIRTGDLTGAAGEVKVLYPRGTIPARRVLVAGLGPADAFDVHAARRAAAAAARAARDLGAASLATIVHGAGIGGLDAERAAQATVEGMLAALYRYDAPKQKKDEKAVKTIEIVTLDGAQLSSVEAGAAVGAAVADGVALARDLANGPPNICTPGHMADTARRIATDVGLDVEVGDRAWAAGYGMGAFLAVAQGAGHAPAFIVLSHNADRTDVPTLVLVGKGVTFDTGGISIKPSEGMEAMRGDMAGAAAVLGAMQAIGRLRLPLRVIGITPCTENMPDANAYRPADVITASNGKTIEIISTDAEGRMILADALVYAARFQPAAVVDLATLTGACVVALGQNIAAGLFSNDDALAGRLLAAGDASRERLWRLPLWPEYHEAIETERADMKNSGGRQGGVATSAVFLQEFTSYPWAHLDIAGMMEQKKVWDLGPAGATGYGVRLLVEFVRGWAVA